jgi:uncharacterized protein involved in outer membrane biogenesis
LIFLMKKFLAVLAGLLAAIALAVILLPYLVPQSYLERRLAPLLAEATGLELREARRLRLSLLPEPAIAVEGVRASLPRKHGRAPDVRADRILAAINPSALLEGRLRLKKLTFENPSLTLNAQAAERSETRPGGASMQRTHAESAAPGAADPLIKVANRPRRALRLPSVEIAIVNGSLAFREDDGGGAAISQANFAFRSDALSRTAALQGEFLMRGERVTLTAQAEPSAPRPDPSMALRVALHSDGARTDLDGALILGGRPHFAGSVKLDMPSGEALARMIGASPKSFARFAGAAIAGQIEISDERLGIADGTLSAPGASGEFALLAEFGGTARATLKTLELQGGKAHGVLSLDARQPDAILGGSFSMTGIDALALGRGAAGFDWISGRADAEIEIAGGGRTLEAIAETLKGRGTLSVASGAIEGLDLPLIVAEAKQSEFDKWRREAGRRTPFDKLAATFTIEEGIAATEDLVLTGPNIAITGEGETDIARGRIDYRLKTRVSAAAGSGAGDAGKENAAFSMPLIIKGDWEKPDIYPDLENAVEDSDSLKGTAKLFGKSVEKFTDGQIKADDFGKMIDGLFGKKKKKKQEADD